MQLSLLSFFALLAAVSTACAGAPLDRRHPPEQKPPPKNLPGPPDGLPAPTTTDTRDGPPAPASSASAVRKMMTSVSSNGSYWFVDAKAGEHHAKILVDSGSGDTVLNAGVYRPTRFGLNLNETFVNSYISTPADGGGVQNFTGNVYKDSVCIDHLKTAKQPLGVLDTSSAQYPGQGIIGFIPSENITTQPFGYFDTLCGLGELEACTFGLAFKPDNSGTLAVGHAPGSTGLGQGTPVTLGGGSSDADAGFLEPSEGWVVQNAASLVKTTINGRPMNSTTVRVFYPDSGTSVTLTTREEARYFFQEAGMRIQELPEQGRVQGFYDCANPPKLGFSIKGQLFEYDACTVAYYSPQSGCPTQTGKRSDDAGPPTLPLRFSAGPRIYDAQSSFTGDMLQKAVDWIQQQPRQETQQCLSSIFGDASVETPRGKVWLVGQNWMRGKYLEHDYEARTLSVSPLADAKPPPHHDL